MANNAHEITTELVKQLRDQTGVGMLDCKKALAEAHGDLDEAATILRKKGVAVAAKRAGNATIHGVIQGSVDSNYQSGTLVEVGCETDFAAKTADMQKFVKDIADAAARSGKSIADTAAILGMQLTPKLDVRAALESITAKIAEKIDISRTVSFHTDANGLVNVYIHPGSLLGVMIMINGDKPLTGTSREQVANVAKDICMHIAVTNPKAISSDRLDKSVVDSEMEIARAQLATTGKPANIIDKILEGKKQKFYEEVCLLNQKFIKDEKITVADLLANAAKTSGVKLTIADFTRFQISAGK